MKKLAVLIALALASVALVACGGDDGTTTTETGGDTTGAAAEDGEKAGGEGAGGEGAGSTIEFEAVPDGGLDYVQDEATAQAGEVTIAFDNPQALAHDVAIEDQNGETIARTDVITEGSDSTTAQLKPGEYAFYCTVPGHREGGMEGTLTVE